MRSYNKNTKPTQQTMKAVEKYLAEKYGYVHAEWHSTLDILADNLDLLAECKASIKAHGIYNAQTGRKNPLIATVKDINATLLKVFQQLGLTPWSDSKIKDGDDKDNGDLLNLITMSEENE